MTLQSSPNSDDSHSLAASCEADLLRMRTLLDRPLPAEELEINTALVAAPGEAKSGRMRSVLVFAIGNELLALEADAMHRVVPVSVVRRVPHRSGVVFAGIANVAGELTPIARLEAALGITAGKEQSHFVVIGAVSARWGFAADRVDGVRRIDESRVVAAPTTVRHAADGCTKYLVPITMSGAEALVAVLDAGKLAALFTRSLA